MSESEQLQRIEDKLDAILNLLVNGELPQKLDLVKKDTKTKSSPKRVTEITEEFRADMLDEFDADLREDVLHQIDLALAHKASTKYHDKKTYVRNWLRKAVEYKKQARGSPEGLEARRDANRSKFDADYERRRSEDG